MEEVSQDFSKFFSARIVSIDFYMAPPITNFDISYSEFQGASVKEVPVIRIFGSTPAGQKACVHVHRALPYFYVPCSDIPLQLIQEGSLFENAICLALEKALKLKGNAGSKRQHVHSCSLVRAKKIYGYHSSEELFVKIYLYYPHDVSRAANLLLNGAVFEKCLQPYESHIPFLLQFLVDYNLCGMGHMHLVKMKFRHPVPDLFAENADHFSAEGLVGGSSDSQADATTNSSSPLVWRSSTIPDEWMWQAPSVHNPSSSVVHSITERQSTCELEGDTTVEDILNQHLKMYTSLSQTCSDVRMVQSLVPIWEEEFERSGVQDTEVLADPDRPSPEDVLLTLSNDIKYIDRLKGLYSREDSILLATSEDVNTVASAQCFKEVRSLVGPRNQGSDELVMKSSEDINNLCDLLSPHLVPDDAVAALLGEKEVDKLDMLQVTNGEDMKVADPEDVALLKWLASSQAEEDINSDDELHRETILNPLLPAATIDKVLEKANTDYENESQQECQDILDSIADVSASDDKTGKTSTAEEVLDMKVPQLDDNQQLTTAANSPDKMGIELVSCKRHTSTSGDKKKRHKSQWGSLPFSEVQITGDVHSDQPTKNADYSGSCAVDSRTLLQCSVRDLMRKKRCFQVESSESRKSEVGVKGKNTFLPRKLDFLMESSEEQNIKTVEVLTSSHTQVYEHSETCEFRHSSTAHCPVKKEMQDIVKMTAKDGELDFGMPSLKSGTCCLNRSDKLADKPVLELSDNIDMTVDENSGQVVPGFSSCLYKCERKRNICLEGDHVGKLGNELGMSTQLETNITSDNVKRIDDPQHDKGSVEQCAPNSEDRVIEFDYMEREGPRGYISMTCHKKPGWKNGGVETVESLPVDYGGSVKGCSDDEGTSVKGASPQDVLPFFPDSGKDVSEQPHGIRYFYSDSLTGVPTHYQNDGSRVYLLTPAVSPPSINSVLEWLTLKEKAHDPVKPLPDSSQISPSKPMNNPHNGEKHRTAIIGDLMTDGLDSSHFPPSEPMNNPSDGENHRTGIIEGECMTDGLVPNLDGRGPLREKELTKVSQDISQISGPSGQPKPTPLSQIGFRDPASLGAGQQLTLLSIEVQAECRGDLQPDPQNDAINIIVMTVQSDDNPSVDVHVLLHGAIENFGRNLDGVSGCRMLVYSEERELLDKFISITCSIDPDILLGWDIQGSSVGFLAERASHLGISLINQISRIPAEKMVVKKNLDSSDKRNASAVSSDSFSSDTVLHDNDNTIIEDEWGRTHASGVHVTGRIVLNVWRLARSEVKLNIYSLETVAEAILRRKVPSIHWKILNKWFSSGPGKARFRCINFLVERAKLNVDIVNQLDMINRTSELARVFGIDFFSVLSRGSQYRVESMLVRLAHTQNYLLISPGHQQVASQPAMECLPLVMEPESGFYSDPVVVLDFQALYPSMIIAYNLCFSTCLGNVFPSKADMLGVSSYSPDMDILKDINLQILITPNGVMYVPSKVRKGVLPRLLDEILSTRVMVKQAMKTLAPSQQILQRIFNSRQLALKLIANVTYGYTAAGFSGRMPCAELADSIVQCGRRTLENAISFVNTHSQWNARVIYGDTDSMFVLLKERTMKEAFQIGNEIASTISAMNPNPVKLKMEKVYKSCFLLTKKRYVGYSCERLNQLEPIFDAKGIETVRRDTCPAVAKTMEKSLRMFFELQDISKVRSYLQRQWSRILSGRVSIQDFVFAKEVRLGTYNTRTSASLPPAAIVASKAMRVDPRAEPRYAERVPYVVVHGEPGARLVDMVVDPQELLSLDSPHRLNDLYYIRKQIIPALQRVFGLVGADLSQWFQEMPRPVRDAPTRRHSSGANSLRTRIDFYYSSKHCVLCGELVQAANHLCEDCSKKGPVSAAAMTGRTSKLERDIQHLVAICRHCGGGDWLVESGVKCTSLACSVYYERRKVQKELRAFSAIATEAGFYPRCMVEWF